MPSVEVWAITRRARGVARRVTHPRRARREAPDPARAGAATDRDPPLPLDRLLGREAATVAAVTTPAGRVLLPGSRPARAVAAWRALPAGDRAELAATIRDACPVLAAYLCSALAAGRSVPTVLGLHRAVGPHHRDADWLHRHLGVLDAEAGPAAYLDDTGAALRLRQHSGVACGPTSLIVARVLLDPVYALWLTTGRHAGAPEHTDPAPFEQRFRAEQRAVHRTVTRHALGPLPWPRALGSPPWVLARVLNRFSVVSGARFTWQPVDSTDPEQVAARLDAVIAGLDEGVPVPLYLGRHIDRHVVLAIGHGDSARQQARLHLYDPAHGEVVHVAVADIVAGRARVAGWDRLESILRPTPIPVPAP